MGVPADLASRMAALFVRMSTRGETETTLVLGKTTQLDQSGTPVARARGEIGMLLQTYVAMGGGTEQPAQEGNRASDTHQFGVLVANMVATDGVTPAPEILTEANYTERWLQFPARDNATYRITHFQAVGPYMWGIAERGGTADIAGGTK